MMISPIIQHGVKTISEDIFNKIFDKVLNQAIEYGFVDMETVFGDGNHQKANANKNKHKDVEIEMVKKVYKDAMLEEINKDIIEHGKKPLKDIQKNRNHV